MNCQNRNANKARCSCTYEPCSRKGVCCDCVEYHRRNGELPGCYFDAKAEATYDRSVAHFVRIHAGRR